MDWKDFFKPTLLKNHKIPILLIIASIFLVTNLVNAQDYVPGDVIVGFYDNVTEDEATALVESYGLSWESNFPKMFSFWVKVLAGSPEYYIDDLESSDIVLLADYRGNPKGEPGAKYILVQFNIKAANQTAHQLIDSFDNLEVSSSDYGLKWGVVKVPEGKEQKWIETFEKENIVRYAQLNGIETLEESGDSTEGQQQESVKSDYLYYLILIGILLLIIILFFILRKRR